MQSYKRKAGEVQKAQILDFKLHTKEKKVSPAQKAGLAYEEKIAVELALDLDDFTRHPALRFMSRGRLTEHAIPDGIAWSKDRKVLTVIEIKLHHTHHGYDQLNNLYKPILQKIYPGVHINLLEIVKNYYPNIRLPGPFELIDSIDEFIAEARREYGIFIWSR